MQTLWYGTILDSRKPNRIEHETGSSKNLVHVFNTPYWVSKFKMVSIMTILGTGLKSTITLVLLLILIAMWVINIDMFKQKVYKYGFITLAVIIGLTILFGSLIAELWGYK